MQYYTFLALEIANERTIEAQQYRLAQQGAPARRSRLARLLRELAGNVGAAISGRQAEQPAHPAA
jgi:hypothetical protein